MEKPLHEAQVSAKAPKPRAKSKKRKRLTQQLGPNLFAISHFGPRVIEVEDIQLTDYSHKHPVQSQQSYSITQPQPSAFSPTHKSQKGPLWNRIDELRQGDSTNANTLDSVGVFREAVPKHLSEVEQQIYLEFSCMLKAFHPEDQMRLISEVIKDCNYRT